jgi:hypothetical protein
MAYCNGVDFVTNVFERTYRKVLQPGVIAGRVADHRFAFAKRVVLVNNVTDSAAVEELLRPLVASGEITEYYSVSALLESALNKVGLSRQAIEKTIHYTDCSLVAVTLCGSSHLLYSDADVFLREAQNWIEPALQLMETDKRVAIANPKWVTSEVNPEMREAKGDFNLGYGFSDQLYLLRREEFSKPIYRHFIPISYRYPLSHISPIFEQRVDAYMRANGRLRATYQLATYVHDDEEGVGYRRAKPLIELKRKVIKAAVKLCGLLPTNDPRFSL